MQAGKALPVQEHASSGLPPASGMLANTVSNAGQYNIKSIYKICGGHEGVYTHKLTSRQAGGGQDCMPTLWNTTVSDNDAHPEEIMSASMAVCQELTLVRAVFRRQCVPRRQHMRPYRA